MNVKNIGMAISDSNQAVSANLLALGAEAVMAVAGNDIANTVGGQLVTPAFLHENLAVRVRTALGQNKGAV